MAAYVLIHCYILLVMKMKIMPTLLCWRVIVLQEVDTLHKWPCPFPAWCWPIQSDQTASHSFPNPDKQFWVATCISKSGCLGKTLEDTTHLFLRHSKPKSCSENEDPDVQLFSHVFVAKNNNNFQQHQGWMKMQFLDSIENYGIIQTSCLMLYEPVSFA